MVAALEPVLMQQGTAKLEFAHQILYMVQSIAGHLIYPGRPSPERPYLKDAFQAPLTSGRSTYRAAKTALAILNSIRASHQVLLSN